MNEEDLLEGFEKFRAGRKLSSYGPSITVVKGGRLGINRSAYEQYFENHPFVEMYFKPATRTVGLKLLKEPTTDAYRVRVSKSNAVQINCMGFFKYYKIDTSKKHTTDILSFYADDGILLLKILED